MEGMEQEQFKKERNDNCVVIKVQMEKEHEIYFRIRRDKPIRKVLLAYCDHLQLEYDTVRFTLDGRKLKSMATADDLGLQHHDTIDAFHDQCGGGLAYPLISRMHDL
ncbi:hypothetical protein ACH5RR_041452 [Cinchona calisaya]|uniref:Ubiquitin-like domain-containing protein n=1 Tax=Cinchona calisaya TaxID=153742 RepID=A0ABD2XXK9_9GENT